MTSSTAVRLDAGALPTDKGPRAGLERAIAGTDSARAWIHDAARHHGITYVHGPLDEFADAVSRLADAEANPDGTVRVLTALGRAGIVSDREAVLLHAALLRQQG